MVSAREAHQHAGPGEGVIGWKLDRDERRELLARFPPAYAAPDADHVTLSAGVARASVLPEEHEGEIIGRSDDGKGVEAMVVRIDGTTDRPDGSTYHITWSIEPGRHARESNDVIRVCGWQSIEPPVHVTLRPASLR
jgi:hypothetical protein